MGTGTSPEANNTNKREVPAQAATSPVARGGGEATTPQAGPYAAFGGLDPQRVVSGGSFGITLPVKPPMFLCDLRKAAERLERAGTCPVCGPTHLDPKKAAGMKSPKATFTNVKARLLKDGITVVDVPARLIASDRLSLRKIHQLEQILALPDECRVPGKEGCGFMYIEKPSELKEIMSTEGAQVLFAVGKNGRLFGIYVYDFGAPGAGKTLRKSDFSGFDADLIKCVHGAKELKNCRVGVAYMVGVDPSVEKSLEDGGAGVRRHDVLLAMHAYMVEEAKRSGIDKLIGYYRTDPPNRAQQAHYQAGYQDLDGCTFEYPLSVRRSSDVITVKNQAVVLDLKAPRQTELLRAAQGLERVAWLNLDAANQKAPKQTGTKLVTPVGTETVRQIAANSQRAMGAQPQS